MNGVNELLSSWRLSSLILVVLDASKHSEIHYNTHRFPAGIGSNHDTGFFQNSKATK